MPIKIVLNDSRVPVKIWTDNVEDSAKAQLINTASLPFVFKHVAVMPDVHWGMGATVGSVIATKDAVCPCAVGVDIGCGMVAVRTNLDHKIVSDKVSEIRKSIERSIPVGHEGNRQISKTVEDWSGWGKMTETLMHNQGLYQKCKTQLGSLGGGNHFIEICLDTDNNVWIMLHSGSRNVGKTLADYHINKAKGIINKMMISLPDLDLAYFAKDTPEFDAYLNDVLWCQDYALFNRQEMVGRVLKDLSYAVYGEDGKVERLQEINCHHNYISHENHYGENVLVTRKGAVRARQGDWGIIPGSMGTRSYIVQGLGNPESFNSCSHGAGRRMSRAAARKTFTVDDLKKQTDGVDCRKDNGIVDEIPGAYKPIEEVMANQSDLVEIKAELKQILCVKG